MEKGYVGERGLGCRQERWQEADADDMYLGYKIGFIRIGFEG